MEGGRTGQKSHVSLFRLRSAFSTSGIGYAYKFHKLKYHYVALNVSEI